MCDSSDGNWVWTVRDRDSGKPVESPEGYAYYFADEQDARTLLARLNSEGLELHQLRDPGA